MHRRKAFEKLLLKCYDYDYCMQVENSGPVDMTPVQVKQGEDLRKVPCLMVARQPERLSSVMHGDWQTIWVETMMQVLRHVFG